MNDEAAVAKATDDREWTRAAGLLAVAFSLSVLGVTVLIAVPVLLLLLVRRPRGGTAFWVSTLAAAVVIFGGRDWLWFAERAWALTVAGWFVALTLAAPAWRLSSRAIASVLGAVTSSGAYFAVAGGWGALDWQISSGLLASVATALDAVALVRDGQPMPPALVAGWYQVAEAQASVYPALLALASAAALGVAWWVVNRVVGAGDAAIGPTSSFRFNDHLVWLLIGGLVLVLVRWGDSVTRVGANVVAFMGALYALRGAGVVMFMSGGLSMAGYLLFAIGLVLAAPAVIGAAILIGIGDTWLDVRTRAEESAA